MPHFQFASGAVLAVAIFSTCAAAPSEQVVTVTAPRPALPLAPSGVSPEIELFEPPGTIASITGQQIEDTTNTVDVEDALEYLPSLFLRKRDFGDTQPTLESRVWGINSSARTLVYVDDIPISALISNNNTSGAPRWGMVSPGEVAGIDVLYGPFAAEFPGNSMGGVVLITTRMPDHFEATVDETGALQTFDLYRTDHSYLTQNSTATVGDRNGPFSWFLSFNREASDDQPLYFVTGVAPAGTTGAIAAVSKTGAPADVLGAGGIQHAVLSNVTGKLSYDFTEWLRGMYTVGYFDNETSAGVQSYLSPAGAGTAAGTTAGAGAGTFGGAAGFASDTYDLREQHLMNALSLKTHTNGKWDWEAVFTRYDYLEDTQRNPAGVLTAESLEQNGYIARMDGTGWSTEDLKAIWRPTGPGGAHEVSAGVHRDEYVLDNPTYDTDDWAISPDDGNGTLHTDGRGRTETDALWAQDAWRLAPDLLLTTGGRLESWHADDGFNLAGHVAASQPVERARNFSPKATLAWQVDRAWSTRLSLGGAYRYPTVGELYQIVSTGATYSIPDPNLAPERVYAGELAIERKTGSTELQLSLFQQNTRDALISQMNLLNGVYTTTVQNIGETRTRGVELVASEEGALVPGLTLSNSLTYADSVILSDPTFASSAGTTATGKRVPYVPDWRDTLQAVYRIGGRLTLSAAARYQGKMFSTLDNTDYAAHVFGAFDDFFVVDAHAHYRINRWISVDAGVDNLFDERYLEYHPFPMRTFVAGVKVRF